MSDIPPGRYRIVERKGRIIVTDTWANGRPSLPPATIPGQPRRSGDGPPARARLGSWLVALACLGATDDAGRSILATQNHFDEKGPRSIVLSDAGAGRLGDWLRRVAGLAVALMVSFVFAPFMAISGVILIGLAFSTNTAWRPAITRWLTSLGDDLPA